MTSHFFDWSVRMAFMAAGTALILRAFRIQSPSTRHAAWTAMLAATLLMPAWTAWGLRWDLPVLPAAPQPEFAFIDAPSLPLPSAPAAVTPTTPPASTRTVPSFDWPLAMFALYLVGALALITRLAAGTMRALSLLRSAAPNCAVPVTVGWLRPRILLPMNWSSWPAAEREAILIHEREHARRRDPLVQWFALLNRAIFWFHPVAWWLERHLAGLAEEACDDAVLARGHDPQRYSESLIAFAAQIRRSGARIPALGTAIGGGRLTSRIERILNWAPAPRLSALRSATSVGACALALATFVACNLGQAPQPLSMNEMAKRDDVARQKTNARSQARVAEAKRLTPAQAAAMVAALKENPQDPDANLQVRRYFAFHSDPDGRDALILWYIEHAPGGKVRPWNISPTRPVYARGKELWLAYLNQPDAPADIYERAASYLQAADKPLAEATLMDGRAAHPADPRWPGLLGQHYAAALLGAIEPSSEFNSVHGFSSTEAHGEYAQSVQAKLERSSDAQVLGQTAQSLSLWGSRETGLPANASLALATKFATRAIEIVPEEVAAGSVLYRIHLRERFEKLKSLRQLSPEQINGLSLADRRFLLEFEMKNAWGPVGKSPDLTLTATKAQQLLALAQQNPTSPDAIYEATFMLGKIALRNGDKREAARYLLAAADAPPSDRLRHEPVWMNLPRALVDWGERDTAAQFLERVAPKTTRTAEFQSWAAQLRKGENPNLIPTMIGCGQEPC